MKTNLLKMEITGHCDIYDPINSWVRYIFQFNSSSAMFSQLTLMMASVSTVFLSLRSPSGRWCQS